VPVRSFGCATPFCNRLWRSIWAEPHPKGKRVGFGRGCAHCEEISMTSRVPKRHNGSRKQAFCRHSLSISMFTCKVVQTGSSRTPILVDWSCEKLRQKEYQPCRPSCTIRTSCRQVQEYVSLPTAHSTGYEAPSAGWMTSLTHPRLTALPAFI
jgi:hypothetical protein